MERGKRLYNWRGRRRHSYKTKKPPQDLSKEISKMSPEFTFQVRKDEGLKISGNRHVHNIRLYCKVANDKFRVLSKNVFPEKTFSPTEAEILYSHCRAPNILSAPENSDLSSKNAYYWDPFH